MIDFKTWWNYRDGKAMTITCVTLLVLVIGFVVACEPQKEHPDICRNLCIIDKNGIPRYQEWFEKHPEDKPEAMFIY